MVWNDITEQRYVTYKIQKYKVPLNFSYASAYCQFLFERHPLCTGENSRNGMSIRLVTSSDSSEHLKLIWPKQNAIDQ